MDEKNLSDVEISEKYAQEVEKYIASMKCEEDKEIARKIVKATSLRTIFILTMLLRSGQ